MYQVSDSYPGDAIGGADFITLAAQRRIVDTDAAGEPVQRLERILVMDRAFSVEDHLEGRVCLSEQTVRTMAGEFGLVDQVTVRSLERRRRGDREQLERLAEENRRLKAALDAFGTDGFIQRLYVAPDGSEHATAALARGDADPVEIAVSGPFEEVTP